MATHNAQKSRMQFGVQSAFGTAATTFGTEHPILEGGGGHTFTYDEEDDRSVSQVGDPETDLENEAGGGQIAFYGDHNKGDRIFHSLFGTTEQIANGTIYEKYYKVNLDGGSPLTYRTWVGDIREQYIDYVPNVVAFSHAAGQSLEFTVDGLSAEPTETEDTSANSIATRTKMKGKQVVEHEVFGTDLLNQVRNTTVTINRNYDGGEFFLGPLNRGEPAPGDFTVEIVLEMRWTDDVYDISQSVGSRGILEALKDRTQIGSWFYRIDNGESGNDRRATCFYAKRCQVQGEPLRGDAKGKLPATIRLKALDATVAIDDIDLLGSGTGNQVAASNCPLAMGRLNAVDTGAY